MNAFQHTMFQLGNHAESVGAWDCPKCGNHNFANRTHCNMRRCHEVRRLCIMCSLCAPPPPLLLRPGLLCHHHTIFFLNLTISFFPLRTAEGCAPALGRVRRPRVCGSHVGLPAARARRPGGELDLRRLRQCELAHAQPVQPQAVRPAAGFQGPNAARSPRARAPRLPRHG